MTADPRNRATKMHFAGHVRIVTRNHSITINHPTRCGFPVCGTTSPNMSWVVRRDDAEHPITCKRCLHLISEHDRTARDKALLEEMKSTAREVENADPA
jgi:hypothetical protein